MSFLNIKMNNIHNKLINKNIIENIINKYMGDNPIRINNIKKFQKAFIHKSFCIIDNDNSDSDNCCAIEVNTNFNSSNERLEFLGDKVIDLITTEFLFDKYPDKDEGFLTKLKSRLVKKESLSYLGDKLGFKNLLLLSSHVERISGRNNPRFLEDIFESFIGILYKDQHSNLNICKIFLLGVYDEFIDLNEIINNNDNYKDSLLRYFHSKVWDHPVYKNIYHIGNVYSREFTTLVLINNDNNLDTSIKSKIQANQQKILNVIKNDISFNQQELNTSIFTELQQLLQAENKIILGIGKGNTKKITEQNCSKDCLINLNISLNY